MILLDANVLVLDLMFPNDPDGPANAAVLARLAAMPEPAGVVSQGLLEVTGKRSFNTPAAAIPTYHQWLLRAYRLVCVPALETHPDYAGVTVDETMVYIAKKMSLGDAVMAAQIEKYAPDATALLTWNAKHFVGKLPVPVLTPADWLAANPPPAAP